MTVVVASKNRRNDLAWSLGRHRGPVVLVDNAWRDDSVELVRKQSPQVRTMRLPRTLGAYGRTLGARSATTEFVAFADDDSWWATGSLRTAADLVAANPVVAAVDRWGVTSASCARCCPTRTRAARRPGGGGCAVIGLRLRLPQGDRGDGNAAAVTTGRQGARP